MTVSRNSIQDFTKDKSSIVPTSQDRFKGHNPVLPGFILTILASASMIFMLLVLVPGDVIKVFAQGQQDDIAQDSDQKPQTSSSLTTPDSASSPSLKDKVTIDLTSAEFAPLTSNENNQLKIVINYKTNDPALVNTPMAGTMKVYDSNGNIIKTSKIGNGYVLGQSGPMHFATTLTDKAISKVKADVYLTDTSGDKISNTLTTDASLSK